MPYYDDGYDEGKGASEREKRKERKRRRGVEDGETDARENAGGRKEVKGNDEKGKRELAKLDNGEGFLEQTPDVNGRGSE